MITCTGITKTEPKTVINTISFKESTSGLKSCHSITTDIIGTGRCEYHDYNISPYSLNRFQSSSPFFKLKSIKPTYHQTPVIDIHHIFFTICTKFQIQKFYCEPSKKENHSFSHLQIYRFQISFSALCAIKHPRKKNSTAHLFSVIPFSAKSDLSQH